MPPSVALPTSFAGGQRQEMEGVSLYLTLVHLGDLRRRMGSDGLIFAGADASSERLQTNCKAVRNCQLSVSLQEAADLVKRLTRRKQ